MTELRGYLRWWAYIAVGFVLLSAATIPVVPLVGGGVWIATLLFIGIGGAVGLIGLAVVGVSRAACATHRP